MWLSSRQRDTYHKMLSFEVQIVISLIYTDEQILLISFDIHFNVTPFLLVVVIEVVINFVPICMRSLKKTWSVILNKEYQITNK